MPVNERVIKEVTKMAMEKCGDPDNPMYRASEFHAIDVAMGWIAACIQLRNKGVISNQDFQNLLRDAAVATADFNAERKKSLI